MKLYYGTTSEMCRIIRRSGLSSGEGEIWLSCSVRIAKARALRESRYGSGKPIIAECSIYPARESCDKIRLRRRGPMAAITGEIPPGRFTNFIPVHISSSKKAQLQTILTSSEVFSMLDSPSPRIRVMGIMMLSNQESSNAFDWLCSRMEDPDPRVRLAVAMSLRRMNCDTPELINTLKCPPQQKYSPGAALSGMIASGRRPQL